MRRRPPRPTLFPYTTLFRSLAARPRLQHDRHAARAHRDRRSVLDPGPATQDRKSTRLNSSHVEISYAVFCLKKKTHISHSVRSTRSVFSSQRLGGYADTTTS